MTGKVGTRLIRRAAALLAAVILIFGALSARILILQTNGFERYQDKVIEQMTTESPAAAGRGEIYDINGKLLATNVTTYRVYLSPSAISTAQRALDGKKTDSLSVKIATALSEILEMSYEKIYQKTQKSGLLDETVKRDVDEETAQKIRVLIKDERLENLVCLEATSKRYYPYGSLASHVIGFTGTDGVGLYGLEYQYNEELAGQNGYYVTARDSRGNELPIEYQSYVAPVNGLAITTTVDAYVQAALEEQLESAVVASGALNRACGIVMDVKSGAILALAVYPGYDLNDPWVLPDYYTDKLEASGLTKGSVEYSAVARGYLLEAWSNKALTETYIPGSTFKIITSSMALEEDLDVVNRLIFCGGSKVVLGKNIHCHKRKGHGSLTFAEGIQQSCNVWFMTLGQNLGTEAFARYFKLFGYREKTGIDLPGEGMGVIASKMSELDLSIYAFGQNFTVTAIQHIRAIAAVANGGTLVTPYLVERMTNENGEVIYRHETETSRRVVDEQTAKQISEILAEGVSGTGGAKNAYVAGYRIAAKTGTSEKKGETTTGTEMYVCSCVGYAPAEDPQVAMIIMVDEPSQGLLYGSTVAAPYIGKTFEAILPYLGVEPIYTEAEAAAIAAQIPRYEGLPVAHARAYAESKGLSVEIVGEGGYVSRQVPSAGSLYSGTTAKIIFYTEETSEEMALTVPNVIGKTAFEANVAITNGGFNIRLKGLPPDDGDAVVAEQYPAAGTVAERGSIIEIDLRSLKNPE